MARQRDRDPWELWPREPVHLRYEDLSPAAQQYLIAYVDSCGLTDRRFAVVYCNDPAGLALAPDLCTHPEPPEADALAELRRLVVEIGPPSDWSFVQVLRDGRPRLWGRGGEPLLAVAFTAEV